MSAALIARYLETLDGVEVFSAKYERVVGVKGNKVVAFGETIDTIDTAAKAQALFDEYVEQEYGSTGALDAAIRAEFG